MHDKRLPACDSPPGAMRQNFDTTRYMQRTNKVLWYTSETNALMPLPTFVDRTLEVQDIPSFRIDWFKPPNIT